MNKKLLIPVLTLALVSLSACEGSEEEGKSVKHEAVSVPAAVSGAFEARYAGAQVVDWEMEDDDFEVNFTLDGLTSSAVFDENGQLLIFEQEVDVTSLPLSIMTYVSENYPNHVIKGAESAVETGGATQFEVQISLGSTSIELVFDAEGNYIDQAAAESSDEDQEDEDEDEDDEHEG